MPEVQPVCTLVTAVFRFIDALRVGCKAGHVEATFSGGFSLDRPLCGDDGECLEVRPALRGVQAVELVEDMAAADFEAAVVFLDGFVKLMRRLAWGGLEGLEKVLH